MTKMTKPNQINFKDKTLEAGGDTYHIITDIMSYEHTVEFISFIPELTNGISYLEFQKEIKGLMEILSSGNNLAKNYVDAYEKVLHLFNTIVLSNEPDFLKQNLDQHIKFCCIFCIKEGEDMTKFNPTLMEEKFKIFKKDVNVNDFFLLAKMQLPGYKELLQEYYSQETAQKRASKKEKIKTLKDTQ